MNELLERYYTEKIVSNFLISTISTNTPDVVLDLGVGEASLLRAAYEKWKEIPEYFGIDIDAEAIQQNKNLFPYCNFICLDALKLDFLKNITQLVKEVDVAICNPPYTLFANENNEEYDKIFETANLKSLRGGAYLCTETIFLAYNLALLKKKGTLGIILPDGILTSKNFRALRADLLLNHKVTHIIELPEKVFDRTEAKTHILIIKKGKSQIENYAVNILKLYANGETSNSLIKYSKFIGERMDYSFLAHQSKLLNGKSLKELGISVVRGCKSTSELRKSAIPFFHTTDFKKHSGIHLSLNSDAPKNFKATANTGDVLMSRVGKRSAGRFGIVTKGTILVSDCIFILKVPESIRSVFYDFIQSEDFKISIELLKHGVCSQVISKSDLENLKIDLLTPQS